MNTLLVVSICVTFLVTCQLTGAQAQGLYVVEQKTAISGKDHLVDLWKAPEEETYYWTVKNGVYKATNIPTNGPSLYVSFTTWPGIGKNAVGDVSVGCYRHDQHRGTSYVHHNRVVYQFSRPTSGTKNLAKEDSYLLKVGGWNNPETGRGVYFVPPTSTQPSIWWFCSTTALYKVTSTDGWNWNSQKRSIDCSGSFLHVGDMMYAGGKNGKLISVRASDNSANLNTASTRTVAAGDVNSLGYFTKDQKSYLIVGTSIGIIVLWDATNNNLVGLLLVTDGDTTHNIKHIHVDETPYGPVAYFVTETNSGFSTFGRINLANPETSFEVAESITLNNVAQVVKPIEKDNNHFYLGVRTTSNNIDLLTIRKTKCDLHTCETCGQDPYYCGYCASTDKCTLQTECSNANTWISPPMCPTVSSISPTSGSTTGGTTVTLHGTFFNTQPNLYKCKFGTTDAPASSVTSTSVTCLAPIASEGPATVALFFNDRQLPSTFSYEFYDCSLLSCNQCSTKSECGWCYVSSSCASTLNGCTGVTGTQCPRLLQVSPTSLSAWGGSVTFQPTHLQSGLNYYCKVGTTTALGVISGNTVTCDLPSGVQTGFYTPQLMVNNPSTLYTVEPTNTTLEIYDCTSISACSTCITNHPLCKFCPEEANRCQYFNTSGCTGVTLDTCPGIQSITPNVLHTSEAGQTLQITLSSPLDTGSYKCEFRSPDGNVAGTTTLTGSNVNMQCNAPTNINMVGEWTVSILVNDIAATAPARLTVYTCPSDAESCSECVSTSRPLCRWCPSQLQCATISEMGGCTGTVDSVDQCPIITSYDPQQDTLAGNSTMDITVSIDVITGLSCDFAGAGIVPATQTGPKSVQCLVPSSNVSGVTQLSLVNSAGKRFTEPRQFTYYDCEFLPGTQTRRKCNECFNLPGCTWCSSSCMPVATCETPDPACPELVSLEPNFVEAISPTTVTVKVNIPLPDEPMECMFGTIPAPATVFEEYVQCVSPVTVPGLANVQLRIASTQQPWAENSLQVQFFSCPTLLRCNPDACFSFPHCGWCLDTGKCQGSAACLSDPTNIWLNESCPFIESVSPNYLQVARPNVSAPTEEIKIKLGGVVLSNFSKKRAALTDFECAFQDNNVPVTSFDPSTNTFTCTAPVLERARTIDIDLKYKGTTLNSNYFDFDVVDCLAVPACGLCQLSPHCGWCRGSVSCMTPSYCDQEPIPLWSKTGCPRIRALRPAATKTTGGETITIEGDLFVDAPGLAVRLSGHSNLIPVTFISENQLTFVAPSMPAGDVDLMLTINGSNYIEDSVTLSYIQGGVNVAVTASLSSLAGLIAIGAAVALIYMKKRKVGFFSAFKLVEPDYKVIAYGKDLQQLWRWPKDKYNVLENKLLSNRWFVTSIVDTTQPTEQDAVAKALVFFFTYHHKATELIVFHIDKEVHACRQENTIFRTNSMASKFFKFYSKIVGIRFIFHTLARFILELEKLSENRMDDKKSEDNSKSLLSMEMEIDASKFGDAQFADTEANLYQLILTCQKIFSTIRTSLQRMPKEFIQIFRSIEYSMLTKFGSEEAVFKAIGGFLFLRFIGPAITAPHAYGLLQRPPNPVCQRQLVLIGKVMQVLANLVLPGQKETFMLQLTDFISRNIPKMQQYYKDVLAIDPNSRPATQHAEPDEIVRLNALSSIWSQIYTYEKQIRAHFPKVALDSEEIVAELNGVMDELVYNYKQPKKFTGKGAKEDAE